MIVDSRRIVDLRHMLTDEQQGQLGGRMVESTYSCDCPTCSCEPEEVWMEYGYYFDTRIISAMRSELSDDEIVEIIRDLFDAGYEGKPFDSDIKIIEMDRLLKLENKETELLKAFRKLGKEHE